MALLLILAPGVASAEQLARLTGEPGAERIVTDSTPPARARNPESGLPALTPPKPTGIEVQRRPPAREGAQSQAVSIAATGDVAAGAGSAAQLPDDLWTVLAVLAALSALGVAAWTGARLSRAGAEPAASVAAYRERSTDGVRRVASKRKDVELRRALERARRAIALDDVLAPRDARVEMPSGGVDPARLVLEISPQRRRAKALTCARQRGVISRAVRPLGFSYAAVRRARFGERTLTAPSQDARRLAQSVGSFSIADTSSGDRSGAGRIDATSTETAQGGDKGDRISNVIRGIAAFDARHRGSPRERR